MSESLSTGQFEVEVEAEPEVRSLGRLVHLLSTDHELDIRWGARRHGERLPFARRVNLIRVEKVARDSADLSLEVEVACEGWTLNISHGGMRVITEAMLHVGELLTLEVPSKVACYRGRVRVQWVRSESDGVVAGLEFVVEVS